MEHIFRTKAQQQVRGTAVQNKYKVGDRVKFWYSVLYQSIDKIGDIREVDDTSAVIDVEGQPYLYKIPVYHITQRIKTPEQIEAELIQAQKAARKHFKTSGELTLRGAELIEREQYEHKQNESGD